jgi:hypothetical protein
MTMEYSIGEPFHKEEFSDGYPSPTWRFPLIPPENFSDGVLFPNWNFPCVDLSSNWVFHELS